MIGHRRKTTIEIKTVQVILQQYGFDKGDLNQPIPKGQSTELPFNMVDMTITQYSYLS